MVFYNERMEGDIVKISIVLKESLCDCKIQVTDSVGSRDYYINAPYDDDLPLPSVTVEIFDNEFMLSLFPLMADTDSIINASAGNTLKDRFAKKATKAIFKATEKIFLRIACEYRITDINDGDRLNIDMQHYSFGESDLHDALDIIPIEYMFFEVTNFNKRFGLTNAYATNRKDFLKYAKIYSLTCSAGEGLWDFLLIYPIQSFRTRWLTRNKKVFKTLSKINGSDDIER